MSNSECCHAVRTVRPSSRCRTMFGAFDDEEDLSMENEIRQLKHKVALYAKQKKELEEAVVGLNIKFRGTSNIYIYIYIYIYAYIYRGVCLVISPLWCPGLRDINTATNEQLQAVHKRLDAAHRDHLGNYCFLSRGSPAPLYFVP